MKRILLALLLISTASLLYAQGRKTSVAGEEITYKSADGTTLKGYVAYDEGKKGKRPAIVVIPEWWGNNEYSRYRADMLAKLGYIAIAADMYGEGKEGPTPKEAGELATPFYKNPQLAKERIEAAVNKLKEYAETDPAQLACIGYCFGGSMSLNAANLGMDFKGVVSFHGGLAVVPAKAGKTTAKILVCHGAADKFISAEELKNFRRNLDSVKVDYTFISYPDATHAFTNPGSTANGLKFNIPIAYNAAADKKSWEDMKAFFKIIFN
jgi:dienelactone hydrolase